MMKTQTATYVFKEKGRCWKLNVKALNFSLWRTLLDWAMDHSQNDLRNVVDDDDDDDGEFAAFVSNR